MRLDRIPYNTYFRKTDGSLSYGPVYFKPNRESTAGKKHVLVVNEESNEIHLPVDEDVELLEKLSNFT